MDQRTTHLHARVAPFERKLVAQAANLSGQTLSEFLRGAAIREARDRLVDAVVEGQIESGPASVNNR